MSTIQENIEAIGHIKCHEEDLTQWEKNFIESIDEQMAAGRNLTMKQDQALDVIFRKVIG
ncbi:MAG: hypothetical protein ACPGYT_11875 [Nitrospirales bacterium]